MGRSAAWKDTATWPALRRLTSTLTLREKPSSEPRRVLPRSKQGRPTSKAPRTDTHAPEDHS